MSLRLAVSRKNFTDQPRRRGQGIAHRHEVESLWRAGGLAAWLSSREQPGKILEWTPAQGDVHHRSYEKAHHPMQESVGLDRERHPPLRQSARPLASATRLR